MSRPPDQPRRPSRFKRLRRRLGAIASIVFPSKDERAETAKRLRGGLRGVSSVVMPSKDERAETAKRLRGLRGGLRGVSSIVMPSKDERKETVKGLRRLGAAVARIRPTARRLRRFRLRFLWRWCRESPGFRHFLLGLPSMAVAAAVFALAFHVFVISRADTAAHYYYQGFARSRAEDYQAARVCFEQLVLMDPANPDFRFRLAVTLDALNQTGRATNLMNALAPADRPGYAPAHFWLAQRLMATRPPSPLAETHLKSLLKLVPDSADARALLGQLYSVTGRAREAKALLEGVVDDRPELLVLLAQVCKVEGQAEAAQAWAEKAQQVFGGKLKRDPADEKSRTWLALVECYSGRYGRAEAVLNEGRAESDSPLLRRTLGQVYTFWFDALRKEQGDAVEARMAVLERGLKLDPSDPGLLQRLAQAIEGRGPAADRARDALQTVLATGKATGVTHMILGLDAWTRGKPEEAEVHFELAYRMNPETPAIANSLAWVLAVGPHPDPTRALSLIDDAINRAPDVLAFRDTRGFILLKMKRWNDALPDLEAALRVEKPRPELHLALAEAYDNLHMTEVAAKHRTRAAVVARSIP